MLNICFRPSDEEASRRETSIPTLLMQDESPKRKPAFTIEGAMTSFLKRNKKNKAAGSTEEATAVTANANEVSDGADNKKLAAFTFPNLLGGKSSHLSSNNNTDSSTVVATTTNAAKPNGSAGGGGGGSHSRFSFMEKRREARRLKKLEVSSACIFDLLI